MAGREGQTDRKGWRGERGKLIERGSGDRQESGGRGKGKTLTAERLCQRERDRQTDTDGDRQRQSKLVFYAQSTGTVISGR